VKVLSESSIGSGVRRIEALTGLDAFRFLARKHDLVAGIAESLKARPEELADRIESLQVKLRDTEKELASLRGAALLQDAPRLAEQAPEIAGVRVVTHQVPDGTSPEDARALALDLRSRLGTDGPVVVAVFVVGDGRAQVVVASNDAAKPIGLGAGRVVKELAPRLGGGGGGKDDIAQGGGTNAAGVPDAIAALEALVSGT
jgi:alanyl-tRNA synthetase